MAHQLHRYVHELEGIVKDGEHGKFDGIEIPRKTTQIFNELCGEYPGAVAIRDTYASFKKFKRIDEVEARESNPTPSRTRLTGPPA
jgi:hypothetical protein